MFSLRMRSKVTMNALAAMLLFTTSAAAQIPGLCNTGQTFKTVFGCTGVLVTPNPQGGGPNRDGNWALAYPYPSPLSPAVSACSLKKFVRAWVDYDSAWLPNSTSKASEWITPYDGEGIGAGPATWYVYLTEFHVPSVLPGGIVPTGVTINGRLASDNSAYGIYMANPANGSCAFVTGLPVPINPTPGLTYEQWWDFSFTNPVALTPGTDLLLYFVVQNAYSATTPNPTGLRVEFLSSSAFN